VLWVGAFFVSGSTTVFTVLGAVLARSIRAQKSTEKRLEQVGAIPGKSAMAKPGAFKSEI